MTISVGSDQFKNIVEIWDSGPNTLHVVTASYRTIRVSALGNIRSGTAPNYFRTTRSTQKLSRNRVNGCGFGPTRISPGKMEPM